MDESQIIPLPSQSLGELANTLAGATVFEDYHLRTAPATQRRQKRDLLLFGDYLTNLDPDHIPRKLYDNPHDWRGVTWGLLTGFRLAMLNEGYALKTINVRLSTVRKYAELAFKAGFISAEGYALIRTVKDYAGREALNVDAAREVTRYRQVNAKKAVSATISTVERRRLKREHPDNPQGLRDELLMCLLLDHGLRRSEVEDMKIGAFDFAAGTMRFYRRKVNVWQTHHLTPDTLSALVAYRDGGLMAREAGAPLFWQTNKGGVVTHELFQAGGITKRVGVLGKRVGIPNLSPHDCRHDWATRYAHNHTLFELQEAGGWTSLETVRKYVEHAKISNDGKAID